MTARNEQPEHPLANDRPLRRDRPSYDSYSIIRFVQHHAIPMSNAERKHCRCVIHTFLRRVFWVDCGRAWYPRRSTSVACWPGGGDPVITPCRPLALGLGANEERRDPLFTVNTVDCEAPLVSRVWLKR